MSAPSTSGVAAHYARWPFPSKAHRGREGLVLLRSLQRWLAPIARPRVLDAGCGTGETTLSLARRIPRAEFVGVDVAGPALEHARRLATDAGQGNVEFRCMDLARRPDPEAGRFDAVLALGVLHHVPDPEEAFGNLVALAAPGAPITLWLYGRHGRMAHRLNQEFLRLLARDEPEELPEVARAFVDAMGERFVRGTGFYTPAGDGPGGIRWLLDHPVWLADQMFPAFEQAVALDWVLKLFDASGVTFERWFGVKTRLSEYTDERTLLEPFERLDARERLLAIDLLLRPPYYFIAGRNPGPRDRGSGG